MKAWRLLSSLLYMGAGLSLCVALALMRRGGEPFPWTFLNYPIRYLLLAAVCFAAGLVASELARPAGSLKRAIARILLLGVSIVFSLVVGEVGLRKLLIRSMDAGSFENFKKLKQSGHDIHVHSQSPLALIIQPSEQVDLVYELQPNLNTSFGHHQLRTNNKGFRMDHDVAAEKPSDVFRVVGLGDSGMFGWGVEQGESYLDVLEGELNQRGGATRFEVINTGTPGYNTQLEVTLLKLKGLELQPDVVVVGWCENDFYLPHFFFKHNMLPKGQSMLFQLLFDRARFKRSIQGSEIADRHEARSGTGQVDMDSIPKHLQDGLEAPGVRRYLSELARLGREQHFNVLVFGPLSPDVLGIVKELEIPYLNTLEWIAKDQYPSEWGVHQMHPRAEGHRVLGELLADALHHLGWLPDEATAPAVTP